MAGVSSLSTLIAADAARIILESYETHLARLSEVIERAKTHFQDRDWHAVQLDSAHRLDLYNAAVQEGLQRLRDRLGPALVERATWAGLRTAYVPLAAARSDPELAETFFN